jgi:hypothetical protein
VVRVSNQMLYPNLEKKLVFRKSLGKNVENINVALPIDIETPQSASAARAEYLLIVRIESVEYSRP